MHEDFTKVFVISMSTTVMLSTFNLRNFIIERIVLDLFKVSCQVIIVAAVQERSLRVFAFNMSIILFVLFILVVHNEWLGK